MAASRGKTTARKTARRAPPPPPPPDREDEDEEDEEDEDGASTLTFYNPETHVCVPVESYNALVVSKREADKAYVLQVEADTKRAESLFTGFATGASIQADQLRDLKEYAKEQRDEADRQRRIAAEKDLEISRMVRASEDAQLERQRLAAEVERGRQALERLSLELEQKTAVRKLELEAVQRAAAPVAQALGRSLGGLLNDYAGKALGGGAPSPAGVAGAPVAPGAPSPQVSLSIEHTADFKQAFQGVFDTLQPTALACLRAVVCSYGVDGAPPLPPVVGKMLQDQLVNDAGLEKVLALLQAASAAYVIQEQPAQAQAPHAAPN